MSPRRRPRAQRGFTLLELLVTLTVTTIGLIGLLSLHVSLSRGNESNGRAQEAIVIANQTIEQLRSMRPADLMNELTGNPAAVPAVDVAYDSATGRNGLTYRREVSVTTVTATLWRLRVVVGWTDDGAAPGADGGLYDHAFAMEVLRTTQEAL